MVSMVTGSGIDKDTADPTARRGGGGQTYLIVQVLVCSFILSFIPQQKTVFMRDVGVTSLMIIGGPDYQADRVRRYT